MITISLIKKNQNIIRYNTKSHSSNKDKNKNYRKKIGNKTNNDSKNRIIKQKDITSKKKTLHKSLKNNKINEPKISDNFKIINNKNKDRKEKNNYSLNKTNKTNKQKIKLNTIKNIFNKNNYSYNILKKKKSHSTSSPKTKNKASNINNKIDDSISISNIKTIRKNDKSKQEKRNKNIIITIKVSKPENRKNVNIKQIKNKKQRSHLREEELNTFSNTKSIKNHKLNKTQKNIIKPYLTLNNLNNNNIMDNLKSKLKQKNFSNSKQQNIINNKKKILSTNKNKFKSFMYHNTLINQIKNRKNLLNMDIEKEKDEKINTKNNSIHLIVNNNQKKSESKKYIKKQNNYNRFQITLEKSKNERRISTSTKIRKNKFFNEKDNKSYNKTKIKISKIILNKNFSNKTDNTNISNNLNLTNNKLINPRKISKKDRNNKTKYRK